MGQVGKWVVAIAALLLISSGALAPQALAADEHVLDPVLSLAGNTVTTPLDPVPDPGPAHPQKGFNDPCGVATDAYGNIYVANGAAANLEDGVIDVFASDGKFITEVPNDQWPCSIAVDSIGRMYVLLHPFGKPSEVVRYDPTVYEPAVGEIEYGSAPVTIATGVEGMALDPSNDHLYLGFGFSESKIRFDELLPDGSPEETFHQDVFLDERSLAIWGQTHDVYSTGSPFNPYEPQEARAYVLDAVTHEVKLTLDGSNTPDGDFGFTFGRGGLAVDQENGDIYVDAIRNHHAVDQFDAAGNFIGRLELPGDGLKAAEEFSAIAVDQGEHSPNRGYVYVTSGFNATNSHLYAFAPRNVKPPEVRGAHLEEAGETEALLAGEVNPNGASTTYRFEYGLADCVSNPCQSAPVPAASAGAGGSFQPVLAALTGLAPGTTYHFRLVATSHCNPTDPAEECLVAGPDSTFATFPSVSVQACPNASLRVGPSATLADCRAYELVTPPNTNGRIPTGAVFGTNATSSPVLLATADGESVVFGTEGGTLPGSGGGGFYDAYRASRGPDGWHTEFRGLTGAQAAEPYAGGVSPDHGYSLWLVLEQKGSLAAGQYLRGPGVAIEPVGIGSLDPSGSTEAQGRWISSGAEHLIFTASKPLEPGAPPSGTQSVYDRSPGGPTRLVSLLPGEVPQASGQNAEYLGAAAQGSAVAFRLGSTIYVRLGNSETVEVASGPVTFGGVSADGSRVFYVEAGNVFAFETATEATVPVGSGGESTMVNVSADGSHVYFVSPLVLTGTEANSQGAKALAGEQNLYVWDASSAAVRFVAAVEEEDVVGEPPPPGGSKSNIGGLGLWTSHAVAPNQDRFLGPANDPSRTTPDGDVLVFESRARLTDYDNQGHSEIYRYEASAGELTCVSCNPTGAHPGSDARLQSRYAPLLFSLPPVNAVSQITNVLAGGDVVFFQSGDRLAPRDADGRVDVYEWQAQGVRACVAEAGCIRLISGGSSAVDDHLYGASADGSSVFFLSSDMLVGEDTDSTPSIYAARVGGGFAGSSPPPPACVGEACQPAVPAPFDPTTASSIFVGPRDQRKGAKRCPKGKRKVRTRSGKVRCVKRKTHRGRGRSDGGASR